MIRILKGESVKTEALLNEGHENIFKEFERVFPPSLVNSLERNFEYDSYNLFTVFDVLNSHFFGNALARIQFSVCSKEDFREILIQMGKVEDAKYEYYAAYLPEYIRRDGTTQRQTIFIIEGYGKMTFKFAVSCMMHEMIHYYDFMKGQMKNVKESGLYVRGIEHSTNTFIRFSRLANMEGLKIMPNGYGKPFEELNTEVAEFKPLTEEEAKAGWRKMVARLEAGEDIPGVALTPHGTVAFIIV